MDAQEQEVEIERADGGVGRGAHEGVGRGAELTSGEYHGRRRPAALLELVPDVHGVGDHRDLVEAGKLAGQRPRRRAGRQGHGGAGLYQLGGGSGDGRFLGLLAQRLLLEARFLGPPLGEHGTAVHPLDEPFVFQGVEIPAYGHLRDEEGLTELGQPNATLGLELLQDLFTPHLG